MVKHVFSLFLFAFHALMSSAQHAPAYSEEDRVLKTSTGEIVGTLTVPNAPGKHPVALIIAGSGPTDRNGNNNMMKNESLQKLAHALGHRHIASLRYDKRGVGDSKNAAKQESELRFEDYVNDAKEWIENLQNDRRFSGVVVIGHSEGSLIGMMAAGNMATKYISVAGAGRPAGRVIKDQLNAQSDFVKNAAFPVLDSLSKGKTVNEVNPMLYSLFRPSVQPYLISWFKYNPQHELQKLKIPVLILQGTNDIQVSIEEGQYLASANPAATLVTIENMNHIFRIVTGDRNANVATYADPALPISEGLVESISIFILKR
jgi:uncharacterized protein